MHAGILTNLNALQALSNVAGSIDRATEVQWIGAVDKVKKP